MKVTDIIDAKVVIAGIFTLSVTTLTKIDLVLKIIMSLLVIGYTSYRWYKAWKQGKEQ